jgi:hypothetical protein
MQRSTEGGVARHFNYSNVMSTLAVFLVVAGGTAMAAAVVDSSRDIAKKSVKNSDLKKNTLKSNRLRDDKAVADVDLIPDTLTGRVIANDAIGNGELAANSVSTDKIQDNAVTEPKIADNAVGRAEITSGGVGGDEVGDNIAPRFGTVTVGGGTAQNGAYLIGATTASGLGGEELVSGDGWWLNDNNPGGNEELFISEVESNNGGESVRVQGGNDSGTDRILVAQANCLG